MFLFLFVFVVGIKKKDGWVCLDHNINKTNLNANHIQNWFGLVFLAETCFNSFDRDICS